MNLTAQDEISLYVEGVRQALAHLPAATREELLEDLPEHLAEVLAEGGGSLTERLGTPQAYAAELSASAGITGSAPRPPARAARLAELRGRLGEATRRIDDRTGPLLGYAKASDFLVLLRPAWWVLRGYLAAMAFAYIFDDNSARIGLLPRVVDNELFALLLLAGAILGSIWLGRRGQPAKPVPRLLLKAGTAVLAIYAVVGFFEADGQARQSTSYMDTSYVSEFGHVQDVFVYDNQGRLIKGAQLYDQNGQPIRLGDNGCTDQVTGEWRESRQLGYPRCPDQAPFLVATPGETEAGPTPEPTTAPTPVEPSGAAPSPSVPTPAASK
ncbi:HAAS signaling domain-containing protein [Actinoplanes aureus]|uniref:Uncharacterized protein n=1 Tax=Actinoplanes aureus TaxID=2792083 RepID=A0A931FY49_9ACTN|nr:hypothetical protein [Actinoplanes aureus]MBG0563205.1 hypothetical protein [Actinoplanes aureus]